MPPSLCASLVFAHVLTARVIDQDGTLKTEIKERNFTNVTFVISLLNCGMLKHHFILLMLTLYFYYLINCTNLIFKPL